MSNLNSPANSRSARRENRRLDQAQIASRSKYNRLVQRINDSASKYVFGYDHLKDVVAKRKLLRRNNADEAQAGLAKWVWSILIVIGLAAVTMIDYLIVGGTLDYLLGMQRELQGNEDYFFYLKILGTVALLAVEVAIAVGLILLREYYNSRPMVILHWVVGIGLALALTAFAFGLMYTKIKNESVNLPPVADAVVEDAVSTVVTEITDSEIPSQKWVMLVGVCGICFFVHVFALMKADSIADAFALFGYAGQQSIYSVQETVHRMNVNRAAGKTEASYRRAYDQFEAHNAEFNNSPLPSVPSQQDPNQQIPVMRLSPVAQRIIENLQNGAVENLGAARNNRSNHTPLNNPIEPEEEPLGVRPAETGDSAKNFNGNGAHDGYNAHGNANHNGGFTGRAHLTNGDNRDRGDNADDAEADYLRTVLDAQVRNSDGEL